MQTKDISIFQFENHPHERLKISHFIYQAAHTFFTRGLLIPISIISGILIARYLGPAGKGIIAILTVPPTLTCAFGELGIRQSTAYLIAKGEYDLRDIQGSMIALSFITGTIGFGAVMVAYFILGSFRYGLGLNLIFAATTPIILLRRYATGILLGRQMIAQMNYLDLLENAGMIIGILIFVIWHQFGVVGVGFASMIGPLISLGLIFRSIRRRAPLRPRWVSPIPMEILKRGIAFAISLFIVTLNYRIGILMLGKYAGVEKAGIYSVGSSISELLWQIPLSIGVVLFSRSMAWSSQCAQKRLDNVFLLSRITLPITSVSGCFLLFTSYYLVPVVYGKSFVDSIMILMFLLPGAIALSLFYLLHFYASGQGNPNLAMKAFIPGLMLNAILNVKLIPAYGCIGVSFAASISYIVSSLLYMICFTSKYGGSFKNIVMVHSGDISRCWNMIRHNTQE